jgi:hypothetical protein
VFDPAFSDDATVDQHDRHAPVVLGMELLVSVDVAECRIDSEGAQNREGFVTEMTALARHQHDLHGWRLPEAG